MFIGLFMSRTTTIYEINFSPIILLKWLFTGDEYGPSHDFNRVLGGLQTSNFIILLKLS